LLTEIIESYKKDPALEREIFADMLDKICVVANFAIADVSQILENEGKILSNSLLIVDFALEQKGLPKYVTDELSLKSVENLISEFIKQNKNFVIIDQNNEFGLYRKSESPKIKEQRVEEPKIAKKTEEIRENIPEKRDEFLEQLRETIRKYENLLQQQFQKGMDTSATEQLLASLRKQFEDYLNKGKTSRKSSVAKSIVNITNTSIRIKSRANKKKLPTFSNIEEQYKFGLQQIFQFYNVQRAKACIRKTFDGVDEESTQMPMGYYMYVLKDFNVPLPVEKQKEIFIKTAIGGRYLLFDHFVTCMEKVAVECLNHRIKELNRNKDLIKFRLEKNNKRLQNRDVAEPENLQSLAKFIEKGNKLQREMDEMISLISTLQAQDNSTVILEFYKFLGLHDNSVFFYCIKSE